MHLDPLTKVYPRLVLLCLAFGPKAVKSMSSSALSLPAAAPGVRNIKASQAASLIEQVRSGCSKPAGSLRISSKRSRGLPSESLPCSIYEGLVVVIFFWVLATKSGSICLSPSQWLCSVALRSQPMQIATRVHGGRCRKRPRDLDGCMRSHLTAFGACFGSSGASLYRLGLGRGKCPGGLPDNRRSFLACASGSTWIRSLCTSPRTRKTLKPSTPGLAWQRILGLRSGATARGTKSSER
eukprot:s2169_g2.t3